MISPAQHLSFSNSVRSLSEEVRYMEDLLSSRVAASVTKKALKQSIADTRKHLNELERRIKEIR